VSTARFLAGLALLLFFAGAAPAPALDTTITGGKMELINKGDKVLFTDGVELNRGGDRLIANKMTTNKKRDKITAEGNVRLFRKISSTETWEAKGVTGFYNTKDSSGYLEGSAKGKAEVKHTTVFSSTSTRVIEIYADRIEFQRLAQQATAIGRVEGQTVDPETGDHFDFWCEHAFFDGKSRQIVLTGSPQPRVIQTLLEGRRTIRGDKIVYFHESQRMISEGNAQAVFEDKGELKK
jgi:lipopolysaccharide export system protein LptA